MRVAGGKAVSGASLGVLMLEARFPRIPGDIGHAGTWPFPVLYKVVRGAAPGAVVRGDGAPALEAFVAAGRALVADGADGIATSCGFLSPHQTALAGALGVPVAASSLMQIALADRLLPPGKRTGVLTISAASLTPAHLAAAGAPEDAPVGTTEGGRAFTRAILEDAPELDLDAARADMIDAARALVADHPELGAIVLECTNMTPWQADVAAATGLPVFSVVDFLCWFQAGLAPRRWPAPAGPV